MKIGLLADIHEHRENLDFALDYLANSGVEQIVVLGDVVEMGNHVAEVCHMLSVAGAFGVWGNHDFGLCVDPDESLAKKHGTAAMDYMATLRPRLEIEDCYVAHVEPWLNPELLEDLWYFEGPVDEDGKVNRVFDAVSNRIMFAGHYHRWLHLTPAGIGSWAGESALDLSEGRHFVVIHALCRGRFAIYDTESRILHPYSCDTTK